MTFFDFENRETFLFVRWVLHQDDLADILVTQSFIDAENSPDFEIGMDPCELAREVMIEPLKRLLDAPLERADFFLVADVDDLWPNGNCVLGFLLEESLRRINFGNAAEAILVKKGKWAPDYDIDFK